MIPICHVQVLPLLSGVQRAMLEIFERLDRDRFDIHVACQSPGPLSDELERRGMTCHFVPALGRAIRPWRDAAAYRGLVQLFGRHGFQIVHTHSSKPGALGRIAARRAGVPHIVHHVQGFAFHEFSRPLSRAAYTRLETLASRYCDRIIFVNHEERELAIRTGIAPAEKCVTVYNGVDLRKFSPAEMRRWREAFRADLGIAHDEVVILTIGRIDEQKQSLLLPAIAARLKARAPAARWRLLVVGSGPLERCLDELASECGVRQCVRRVPWLAQPEQAYFAADVVLQPSLWEGLPLALIEAQAAALPAVASDVKGNREVVTDRTGYLCRPRDPDDYAARLAELVNDAAMRTFLGAAARRRAEKHFDASANMDQIARLYDELLAQPAREPSTERRAA